LTGQQVLASKVPPTGARSDLAGVLRDEEEGRHGIGHGREVVAHEVVGHEDGIEADLSGQGVS
jgi:hypothetical protein